MTDRVLLTYRLLLLALTRSPTEGVARSAKRSTTHSLNIYVHGLTISLNTRYFTSKY